MRVSLSTTLARHFRQAYTGGSFSERYLEAELRALNHRQANTSLRGANTVAALAYHLHFYVAGMQSALTGGELDTRDGASWETPAIETEEAWRQLIDECLATGEAFAKTLEALPEDALHEPFHAPTNSSTFVNALGVLEHVYYHLGQVVLLRRELEEDEGSTGRRSSAPKAFS